MTDLGEYLRKERERKNLSIKDVTKATHINPKLLQAMEKGDFSDIPGVFYAKNFLKTFLDAVGADKTEFFKTYQAEIDRILEEKRDDPARYYSKLRYSSFKRRNLYLTASLILLLFVSAFCFFYQSNNNLFHVVKLNNAQPTYLDVNLLAAATADNKSPDYSPVNVKIEFQEKCWIQVLRGGEKVVSSVFEPGDIQEFHGYNLDLTLGNPSGLRLFVNGSELTRFSALNRSIRIQLNLLKLEKLIKNE